jgi:hypothetical protein
METILSLENRGRLKQVKKDVHKPNAAHTCIPDASERLPVTRIKIG